MDAALVKRSKFNEQIGMYFAVRSLYHPPVVSVNVHFQVRIDFVDPGDDLIGGFDVRGSAVPGKLLFLKASNFMQFTKLEPVAGV